jgi:hypothetical protein
LQTGLLDAAKFDSCVSGLSVLHRRLLIATVGASLLLGHHAIAQEQWKKVDCASAAAHLVPPAGLQANCFEGAFEKPQGTYDCRMANNSIGYPGDAIAANASSGANAEPLARWQSRQWQFSMRSGSASLS